MSAQSEKKVQIGYWLKWIVAILLSLAVFLIPTSETMTIQIKLFFMITIFAIMLMAFSFTPVIVTALILPVGYVLCDLAPVEVVFKAWSGQIPWLVMGSFFIAAIMERSGLSYRIAYWCLLRAKGNYTLLMYAAGVAGVVLAAAIPAAIARCVIFCTIMLGLCRAMDFKPYSKEAVCTFLVALIAATGTKLAFLTGANTTILTTGLLENAGYPMSYGTYFWYMGIPQIIYSFICITLALLMFRPDTSKSSREYIQQKYDELGKVGSYEKKTMLMVIATLILLCTDSLHGIDAQWVFLIMMIIGFWPGINLADNDVIKSINWPMVFFITATSSIGDVSNYLGAGELLVNTLSPMMPDSLFGMHAFVFILACLANLLMTPLALISGLATPLIDLAISMDINPIGLTMTLLVSAAEMVLPYEISYGLIVYGFNMMKMKDFIKYGLVKMILCFILTFTLFFGWYKFVGIL